MAEKRDRDHLDALRAHAADTRRYFTDALKPERERDVCRAFLRCVGIPFVEREIVAPAIEPVDVSFREARFQVREMIEAGRRRGDEWKEKQHRWNRARSLDDALTDWRPKPVKMSFTELMAALTSALETKARKYGTQCRTLDALVYVNLTMTRVLDPTTAPGNTSALEAQGWRSVAMVFPPWGLVVISGFDSPGFLRSRVGRVLREWSDLDALWVP
jgi:hypothetical protein